MNDALHITSGDIAGEIIAGSGIPGKVFVWHDILYDGPRKPGWPDEKALEVRARFLAQTTGGGLDRVFILSSLRDQYATLEWARQYESIVLWFDACLFDQSMLAHILACMRLKGVRDVELLCVDAFPGIEPFNGLGQLRPEQLASLFGGRRRVTEEQFAFAGLL